MKKLFISLVTLLACSTITTSIFAESQSSQSDSSVTSESGSSETTKTDKANWGKRTSPVPLGETFELTQKEYTGDTNYTAKFDLKVTNVLFGDEAVQKLIEFNEYNQKQLENLGDYEVALVELEMYYKSGDENNAFRSPSYFKIFDEKGKEIKQDLYVSIPDDKEFQNIELYPGTEHKGYLFIKIPKASGDKVSLVYDNSQQKTFFSLRK